jgi:hypothetical protein
MLGWIAGDIAISDPMITGWVNQQSPALTIVVPILVVVFVLIESRIMEGAQATAYALRPKLRPEPAPAEVIITVASQSVEADAPSPISAAKTLETPRQPEPGSTLPRDAGTTSHVQAPRDKRFRLSVWIAVAISVALLWILFRFLSLDFATTTPAIQFTSPTRPR